MYELGSIEHGGVVSLVSADESNSAMDGKLKRAPEGEPIRSFEDVLMVSEGKVYSPKGTSSSAWLCRV